MPYSQRQVMLSFAYVSYLDNLIPYTTPTIDQATIKPDIQDAIAANATPTLSPIAGQWSVVWGPVTYTVPGSVYQDNLMYAVQLDQTDASAPPQYAVAVRGTNGTVLLDWLLEDLDIRQMIPWPFGATGADVVGNVSESASIGITVLLSMQDGATGQTLMEFLQGEMAAATATASVCFTGHSLGAALAPTLALYFRDHQATWDPDGKSIVTTVTFAGPTAGDADFAAYFDGQFSYTGTSPLSWWTPADASSPSYADCVRVTLDVAPLAWNATTMATIPKIYEGHLIHDILPPLGTTEIVNMVIKAIGPNAYTQIQASQTPLTGTFIDASKLPNGGGSEHWVAEAAYQHHCSYPTLLDVPSVITLLPPSGSCATT